MNAQKLAMAKNKMAKNKKGKNGKGTSLLVPSSRESRAALAAEVQLRDITTIADLIFAEEFGFGWRSAFSAAIKSAKLGRALAPEVRE